MFQIFEKDPLVTKSIVDSCKDLHMNKLIADLNRRFICD